jgi:catechol 2,3-dioxygenase-like lactoylglutathione lyase family enzyme
MSEFPTTVHHVGLTVTDLEVSRQWYQLLLNAAPVLDEEVPAVPDHHQEFRKVVFALPGGLVLGLVAHPATDRNHRFEEFVPGWITSASGAPTEASSRSGKTVWTSSGSPTAASPRTPSASPCPSATRTTSPWSSSRPVPDPGSNQPSDTVAMSQPPTAAAYSDDDVAVLPIQTWLIAVLPDDHRSWMAVAAQPVVLGDQQAAVLHSGRVDQAVGGVAGKGRRQRHRGRGNRRRNP